MANTRRPTDPEPRRVARPLLVTRWCGHCAADRECDPQTGRCNSCGWLTVKVPIVQDTLDSDGAPYRYRIKVESSATLRSDNPIVPDEPMPQGVALESWEDLSGTGNHARQDVAGLRPLLKPTDDPPPVIGETPDDRYTYDSPTAKRYCPCGGIAIWLLLGILRPTKCAFCGREIPQ